MDSTQQDVIQFILENDVKFIRLAFCDLYGTHKNVSIMPASLEQAFTKGIAFNPNAIEGFSDGAKDDLRLFPLPATLHILPWRPQQGRVVRFYCTIKTADEQPFLFDGHHLLKTVIRRCRNLGYRAKFSTKSEFYLFKTDDDGNPTRTTLDEGGYYDIAPLDKGENVRREICLSLEQMGISPTSSHHEKGPGQNEIDFPSNDPLTCAQDFLTYKSVVKAIGAQNGLFASFMPKPFMNRSGSGLHIGIALFKNGINLFDQTHSPITPEAESFMEGILTHTPAITAILNPTINSYSRFGSFEAPTTVCWNHDGREHLMRLLNQEGEHSHLDFRSPDGTINPYFAFALILSAGLDGIEQHLSLRTKGVQSCPTLPCTLQDALHLFSQSPFTNAVLGEELVQTYTKHKQQELSLFAKMDPAQQENYLLTHCFHVL